MAEDQQKKTPPSPTTGPSSTSTAPSQQPPKSSTSPKGPSLSRRAFLVGAVGASALLTVAALSPSPPGILSPLIPPNETTATAANAAALELAYENATASKVPSSDVYNPSLYSNFFYFPYDVTVSPYYKDIVVRLPDSVQLTPQSQVLRVPKAVLQQTNPAINEDGQFVAYNTTCVHLRCLVNPGYDPTSGEFRLQCPCHGSQYRLSDGVPVAGPAHDLGLNPLPQITIAVDSSGNITAVNGLNGINGTPGVGRTS
jgi:Rieske Fe-S protein